VKGNVTQASERADLERERLHRLLKRHGVMAEDLSAQTVSKKNCNTASNAMTDSRHAGPP
jgi:hypothetical protein